MSTNYSLAEGSERGFRQIAGLPKATGGATSLAYGDAVAYDRATDNWKRATSAAVRPFGFCGNTDILTEILTTDNSAGTTTKAYTRGVTDTDAFISVIVSGVIKRAADGVIPAGEYVMLSATAPLTEVKAWDGVSGQAIVGRYISNITQHHAANAVPAAADNDLIKIEIVNDRPETGTGA
jgi:hypothetical protein